MEKIKFSHRTPDVLEKKYKEMGMNVCFLSFVSGVIASGASTILVQTLDRGIDFYPRELVGHSWQSGMVTFVQQPFLITSIMIGNTINRLYGAGIYSDIIKPIVAGQTSIGLPFTGYIRANTNIQFGVTNISSVSTIIALYLIGESKPL